ncbi:MAG: zinc ABC transporter substrate-binding protein [Anaerolineae bacterium]|jgi:manganese/zinc/iron transport system substrate-binding protein
MNIKYVQIISMMLLATLVLAACSSASQKAGNIAERQVNIVTTIGMIADVAENVGGERVSVVGLMGPGTDPHLYKASEGDVQRLAEADLILYNGLHLEAKMGEVLERMTGQGVTTVAVAQVVPEGQRLQPEEFEGNYDPHVWFEVPLWMMVVEAVRDALVEVDPGSADLYKANAQAYLEELETLHAHVQEQADRIPAAQRVLITAHDAFNYFGRAYGFQVRGLQGISTESEAGTGDVQELATFIADHQIPAIFVESSVPVRNVEAVQAAVQAKGFQVEIGGELFSDAMGDAGTQEGTYIGMVRHNIDTIVGAFLGQ